MYNCSPVRTCFSGRRVDEGGPKALPPAVTWATAGAGAGSSRRSIGVADRGCCHRSVSWGIGYNTCIGADKDPAQVAPYRRGDEALSTLDHGPLCTKGTAIRWPLVVSLRSGAKCHYGAKCPGVTRVTPVTRGPSRQATGSYWQVSSCTLDGDATSSLRSNFEPGHHIGLGPNAALTCLSSEPTFLSDLSSCEAWGLSYP